MMQRAANPQHYVPPLREAKLEIDSLVEAIDGLTLEETGFYMSCRFKMYVRLGGIPEVGNRIVGCDIRAFRRLRDRLLELGKFYLKDGELRCREVDREIALFLLQTRNRRDSNLRPQVIAGFEHTCQHCGGIGSEEMGPDGNLWCVDRIIPGSMGGRYEPANVTLSCWSCNSKRGNRPIERRVLSLAEKLGEGGAK